MEKLVTPSKPIAKPRTPNDPESGSQEIDKDSESHQSDNRDSNFDEITAISEEFKEDIALETSKHAVVTKAKSQNHEESKSLIKYDPFERGEMSGLTWDDILMQEFVISEIITFLDMKTLFLKAVWLSKATRSAITWENYTLFSKLRDFLHIPTTFDCTDLPAFCDISEIFKNVLKSLTIDPEVLSPFAYFTDGGVDTNSNYYFLQNVWKKTNICYCTIAHDNVHVQSIISKKIEFPATKNNPMNFLEDPPKKMRIRIPFEEYVASPRDPFHLITHFQVHLKSGGYNAFIKSFAVFYSEIEIDNFKFQSMTRRFMKVKSMHDLVHYLKLKVKHSEDDKKSGLKIVEFDLDKKKNIERWLRLKNPKFYPLLWVQVKQKYSNITVNYRLRQRVAAKFISLKLISSSNGSSSSNIDLYNLGLKGVPISFTGSDGDLSE